MLALPRRVYFGALSAMIALGVGTSGVRAGIPALEVYWGINGELANFGLPLFGNSTDLGNGLYNYTGGDSYIVAESFPGAGDGGAVNLSYNITADPDPLISNGVAIENVSGQTLDVFVGVVLPISPSIGSATMGGSATVGLTTDSGGGRIETLVGVPLWQAMIDGASAGASGAMFPDPFFINHTGLQSSSSSSDFGLPNLDVPAGDVLSTIGIDINFRLTAFDQMSLTGPFVVVPTPGGLVLLAGAALLARRRRRRA